MFRGIVSVLQVAGTFVLVMGFAAQSTPVGAAFRGDEWAARLLLDPSELFVGASSSCPNGSTSCFSASRTERSGPAAF